MRTVAHGNPGFMSEYADALASFNEVKVSDVFACQALGYEYDTLPPKP